MSSMGTLHELLWQLTELQIAKTSTNSCDYIYKPIRYGKENVNYRCNTKIEYIYIKGASLKQSLSNFLRTDSICAPPMKVQRSPMLCVLSASRPPPNSFAIIFFVSSHNLLLFIRRIWTAIQTDFLRAWMCGAKYLRLRQLQFSECNWVSLQLFFVDCDVSTMRALTGDHLRWRIARLKWSKSVFVLLIFPYDDCDKHRVNLYYRRNICTYIMLFWSYVIERCIAEYSQTGHNFLSIV